MHSRCPCKKGTRVKRGEKYAYSRYPHKKGTRIERGVMYWVCIFFTPFDSCTLLERVPRMHIMYMPCLCRLGQNDVNPLFDSTFNAHAYSMSCSLNNSIMPYTLFSQECKETIIVMSWAQITQTYLILIIKFSVSNIVSNNQTNK